MSDAEDKPQLFYANVEEFVVEWVAVVHARHMLDSEKRWCKHWALHPEAVALLDALWRAWEVNRLDAGTAMAGWWVNVFYPAMDRLMAPRGTFELCMKGDHRDPPELPTEPAPAGMFVDEREVDFDDDGDEGDDGDDAGYDDYDDLDDEREAFDV